MVGTYAFEGDSTTSDAMAAPAAPGTDVRVRLESLPVPLRVTAGDHWSSGIAIEAELPWLAIGTALDVELPDGGQRGGRIQSFEVDVTSTGAACLRIFADLSSGSGAFWGPIAAERAAAVPGPSVRSWLAPLVFMLGASIGAYAGLQAPAFRAVASAAHLLAGLAARL